MKLCRWLLFGRAFKRLQAA